YHAIGEYLKKSGGQYVIQSFRENIVTGVFSSGFALDNFPQLQLATKKMISEFSPTDYFLIYEHFIENYKNCSLEVMASYLNLSAWDPNLFDHISEHLCELAFEADPDVISYLETHLHLVADNFYYLPSSDDTLIGIGIFFQNIGKSEKAIHYYELSQLYFGNNDIVLFNKAMCLHQLNRREEAIACLREALTLDSNSSDAKEWIEQIQSEA
ncbi:MAG: tetratricopeptide repeat protein, partial [Gammaproteobacteria bacterium]|nr:tetratricopeptide repeat protein [Gammaproteobacteria bacterium]